MSADFERAVAATVQSLTGWGEVGPSSDADFKAQLAAHNLTLAWLIEPKTVGVNGTERTAHYGEGRQPWDDMVDLGWAAAFAAGCVLKYLRRTKSPEADLEKARWYHARLVEMALAEAERYGNSVNSPVFLRDRAVYSQLLSSLMPAERALLEVES